MLPCVLQRKRLAGHLGLRPLVEPNKGLSLGVVLLVAVVMLVMLLLVVQGLASRPGFLSLRAGAGHERRVVFKPRRPPAKSTILLEFGRGLLACQRVLAWTLILWLLLLLVLVLMVLLVTLFAASVQLPKDPLSVS